MVQDGKENCFAYREVRGRLVCSALTRTNCTNCKFYKPKSETLNQLEIEKAVKNYVKGI